MLKETQCVIDADIVDEVWIAGTSSPGLPKHQRVDDNRRVRRFPTITSKLPPAKVGKILGHLEWMARVLFHFAFKPVDVVTCHSLPVLPLAVALKVLKRATLVYSPHELETETSSQPIPRPLAKRIERLLIARADAVVVVGDLIADWYREEYGLDEVTVVRNIPVPPERPVGESRVLREIFPIPDDELLVLYQGGLFAGRGIELMLEAWADLPPDRHLVFLGYGPLEELVVAAAEERPNVYFHPAVAPEELAPYTASADVALSLSQNVSLSYYYSLPNKVLEYLAAGVPAIVSDFPEVAKVVNTYECGWTTELEASALRELIAALTPDEVARCAANTAASQVEFDWSVEKKRLEAAYQKAISGGPAALGA
jgi:glycosyltransferase involved in cell wall biosynthesis